jgi:primosomal protein N' (replication factor Y) (superfamily II helicase)
MSERRTLFADVIIPVSISQEFTYRIPFEMNDTIRLYTRVIVPLKGKFYTAIVTRIHEEIPQLYQARYIELILDENPVISPVQYKFWKWIASYYMAPIGDVMNAALPANFKLASETRIVLHPDFDSAAVTVDDREFLIVEALEVQEVLTLKEIAGIVGIKTIQPVIKKMMDRRIVLSQEEVRDKFTPRTATFVELTESYAHEEKLNELLNRLGSSGATQKQENALMGILREGGYDGISTKPVLRKTLEESGVTVAVLNTLEKKGIIRSCKLEISRFADVRQEKMEFPVLSQHQQTALESIRDQFEAKDTVLLQGITGSGKTEIYIHLISEALNRGQQVLFLVPEIALTTQLIQRLSAYFGSQIGVYHSRFNNNERVEIWQKVLENNPNQFRIIVGARSAVFLPFRDLGLVVIDEEHESSFKQQDPAPRYHGRDTALVLAAMFRAKTLLGTATPSIETWQNVRDEKFGKAELTERYSHVKLPEILCADMKKERIEKTVNGHFSSFLLEEMKLALGRGEQIILFQNRRGHTPLWACEMCGYSPGCVNCDTTLTYHKQANLLKCHHCSYTIPPIGTCPACGSNKLKMLGFGTEKVEDDLSLILPDVRVGRMDYDTTRSKQGYQKIISDFENGNLDILVGTQMVAKGLDFDHVGLVGILDADLMIMKTDFRAFERSFQLMSQVAGRAGRRNKRGKVIIQTGKPDHWVIQQVIAHDYEKFAANEIVERINFYYPPFYKLIELTLKHRDENLLIQASEHLAAQMKTVFHERVIGPSTPPIARIQNFYLKEIQLKIEASAPQQRIKEKISELINDFYTNPRFRPIRINIDVDPQ